MSIGVRIREERQRLALSQVRMAELCGIVREMVGRYESGKVAPGGEALVAMARIGADVRYILTGLRAGEGVREPGASYLVDGGALSAREMELIRAYRRGGEEWQAALDLLARLAGRVEKKKDGER